MEGFKKCSKGHFYREDKANCPYCPKNNNPDEIKTDFLSKTESISNNDPLKTQVFLIKINQIKILQMMNLTQQKQ